MKKILGIYLDLHPFKNLYWRFKKGCGCCDVHDLWYYLAPKMIICLKRFRKNVMSHPSEITFEEWKNILGEMIWALEFYMRENCDGKKGEYKRADRGMKLFGKYFRNLWN